MLGMNVSSADDIGIRGCYLGGQDFFGVRRFANFWWTFNRKPTIINCDWIMVAPRFACTLKQMHPKMVQNALKTSFPILLIIFGPKYFFIFLCDFF